MTTGAFISDAGHPYGMMLTSWRRMEQPSATEILAIRSIMNGRDVIINAQPNIVSIPILQKVYGVMNFSDYGFND